MVHVALAKKRQRRTICGRYTAVKRNIGTAKPRCPICKHVTVISLTRNVAPVIGDQHLHPLVRHQFSTDLRPGSKPTRLLAGAWEELPEDAWEKPPTESPQPLPALEAPPSVHGAHGALLPRSHSGLTASWAASAPLMGGVTVLRGWEGGGAPASWIMVAAEEDSSSDLGLKGPAWGGAGAEADAWLAVGCTPEIPPAHPAELLLMAEPVPIVIPLVFLPARVVPRLMPPWRCADCEEGDRRVRERGLVREGGGVEADAAWFEGSFGTG